MPFLIAVSGFKNSGKTTLVLKLVEIFMEKGLKTGYVKHTCEDISLSSERTDSGKVLSRGLPTVLWSGSSVKMEMKRDKLTADQACSLFPGYDLVILEGGKDIPAPKIWVGTFPEEDPLPPGILATYNSHGAMIPDRVRQFGNDDIEPLCSYVLSILKKSNKCDIEIYNDDKKIPVKEFVSDFLSGGIRGMLSALKGMDPERGISLFLKPKKH
ncbi:MAG TPA: molybdopterin-guanine dinucleotide biosynthesis protein MobB [Synergistales bacterium]|nr:molybdopterin-guanine dinucleotide biosynthesis protein MobB [Synergistales bacterium]